MGDRLWSTTKFVLSSWRTVATCCRSSPAGFIMSGGNGFDHRNDTPHSRAGPLARPSGGTHAYDPRESLTISINARSAEGTLLLPG